MHKAKMLGKSRKFFGRKIFHQILPDILSELDPASSYIPTTPFGSFSDLNSPNTGSTHNFQPWNSFSVIPQLTESPEKAPRFIAEFGVESLPSRKTLQKLSTQKKISINDPIIEKHNYHADGSRKIYSHLTELFPPPKNLRQLIYLSQLTQGRIHKIYAEFIHSCRQRNTGQLYWHFNDTFCATSFSAVDYTLTPKALYYYSKRFYAPVQISFNPSYKHTCHNRFATVMSAQITIINDTASPITAELNCSLLDMNFDRLDHFAQPVSLAPYSSATSSNIPKAFLTPPSPRKTFLLLTLQDQNSILAQNSFFYQPDKFIEYPPADLDAELTAVDNSRFKLMLSSPALIKDLFIDSDLDITLSDNFFDLVSPAPVVIDIQTPPSCKLKLSDLRFLSVNDIMNQ